jgi:chromosome segregation ATPase
MNGLVLAASFLIVTLRGTFRGIEFLEPGTVLDVSREVRSAMIAGLTARDATDEEIAEYRNLHGAAGLIGDQLQDLARQKGDLEDEIYDLEKAKGALAGELDGLRGQHAELGQELENLGTQRDALVTEVAVLEAKAKPAKAVAK